MDAWLASAARDAMLAAADAAWPEECCGLLLGRTAARIEAAMALANVHPAPLRHFEIDPAGLVAAERAARQGGPLVLGYYHSHPEGEPVPSATDARLAAADGRLWCIVAGGQIGAFRALADGPLHGRFAPVRLQTGESATDNWAARPARA